jgi:hypothetical protein
MLSDPLMILAIVACLVVAGILAFGISRFGLGGVEGAKRSNRLMWYRIIAQGVAVVVILAVIWLRRRT